MDKPGPSSRESDKVTQLEARTRAYGGRKRIYMECTVSTEEGRTWQEYQQSTRSRIVLGCPHCGAWVSPEREHFIGWQGTESQAAAREAGAFICPACNCAWDNQDRAAANRQARLLHDGQSIDVEGNVLGKPIASDTLGFRWSAVNNLFLEQQDLAADEWRASHASDEENAEREMRQFVWCVPVAPSKLDQTALRLNELAERVLPTPRGFAPQDAELITAAVDLGKYLVHWIVVAWSPGARGHVVDYGRIEVASADLGVEQALLLALREFREQAEAGWPIAGAEHKPHLVPDQIWIDAGYMTDVVYSFCRDTRQLCRPAVGRGAEQQRRQWYNRPTKTGSVVRHIGEGFHMNWIPNEKQFLVEVDSDHWKTWVHQRLGTPVGQPGSLTLYNAPPRDHLTLARHLTAERKIEEFIAGRGVVVKWERMRRQNHWFDALYNACAAAHFCGVRLVGEPPSHDAEQDRPSFVSRFRHPDGGPWIDTERFREMNERYGL